ncbi:hypothetical protein SDC9_174827 [bioreactor metagenome]|uniref:Uncharacterized protein n=1 Tax=bioreactor metagenome TaxID=1076179 RepID=A0A645GL02_9ZZZZ
MGNTTVLSFTLYIPQVISVPSIKASIITSSPSEKALLMAGLISSFDFTLVTPKLLPPTFGLTKQGNPIFMATSSPEIVCP